MPNESMFSDEEVSEIAREVIKNVAAEANLPGAVKMRELDGQIEFLIESADPLAAIILRPQKRVEEILRNVEEWAFENLREVIPEEDFLPLVLQQMHGADEDVEIKALIEKCYSKFEVAMSKLENGVNRLRAHAQKEVNKIQRYTKPTRRAGECLRFAEVVKDVKPLWREIIKRFEANDYQCDLSEIREDPTLNGLSKGYKIPENLLKDVLKRQSATGQERRKLEPTGFALRHAKQIVNIDGDHETLLKCYLEGIKYIEDVGSFPIHVAPSI
jgi:hypothetical protein